VTWRRGLELGILSALTGICYAALYRVQRSLSDNGVATSTPYEFPRTDVDFTKAANDLWTYLGLVTVLCLLYAWVLFRASRWTSSVELACLVAVPILIQLTLLFLRPTLSIDAYSYLAHGYLAAEPSLNPYQQEAAAGSELPYGEFLLQLGWLPVHPQTPYGPVWTQVERVVVDLTGPNLEVARVLIKAPALAAAWGSAVMIFLLARRVAASLRWPALLGWLWSPIVMVEFAGDGHNDAVMIFFVLVALYCCVRGCAYWATLALGLAVLIKYLPLIFAPLILVALLRRPVPVWSVLVRIALAAVSTVALAALSFGRAWVGLATFTGIARSGTPYPAWTPAGLLVTYVRHWVSEEAALKLTQQILVGLLMLVVLIVSLSVRTPRQLLRSSAVVALAAFALLPGGWPWYAALSVGILVCLPTIGARVLVLTLTVATRSIAVFGNLQILGAVPLEHSVDIDGFVGVMAPALICIPIAIWQWIGEGKHRDCPRPAHKKPKLHRGN
jgi:alpha-1,6-mannosyltransferase